MHIYRVQFICILGDPEVTENLYCDFAYLYWEGCVICSIYLRSPSIYSNTPSKPDVETCNNLCLFLCDINPILSSGLFLYEPAAAAVAVGVPVRGQQQADDHQRPHAPHHLHHQGRGVYQHRARAPLQSRTGIRVELHMSLWTSSYGLD